MEEEFQYLKYDVDADGICAIVLNRPEKLNAFHLPMYEEICGALGRAEADPGVRVILLRGEGRAFCTGRDFTYSASLQEDDSPSAWRRRYKLFSRWTMANDKFVISLVQGYALGGGGSLAIGCDVSLAAEGTRYGYPEVRHNIASKTMAWPWSLGSKRAKEIVTTGRLITAEECEGMGIVSRVVPADQLIDEGFALARQVAAMPYGVPELVKRQINGALRDMIRVTYQDRLFDVDTAAWDAAGIEPSDWKLAANAAFSGAAAGNTTQLESLYKREGDL